MKNWGTYAAALLIGLATPVFVLWLGRTTPAGTDPSFAGVSVVLALAIVAALLAALVPARWLVIALLLSLPIGVLGVVMFVLVANLGEYYWTWLLASLGGIAASLAGGYAVARAKRL